MTRNGFYRHWKRVMIDLNPNHLATVERILTEHVPECEVRAFGSRATWTSKDYSDLDLAIVGSGPLDRRTLGRLKEAFEDSELPIRVDVLDWHSISESFREVIKRDCVIVQDGANGRRAALTVTSGEWSETPFSQAVQVNPTVRLRRGAAYPFVDMASVNPDSRSTLSTEERVFKGSGSKFQNGDTLMARITPCLENGKIARYQVIGDKQEAHGSTEFIVIRGRPNVTDNDFAYYLTQWDEVRNYAIGQMTGTSGRQRVPVDCLDHLEIPLPPLPEQRAIAHVLGTLDDKIELNRRMNETLEEMARALFKSWFVDFDPVRAKMEGRWRRGESLPGLPAEYYDLFSERLVASELGEVPEGWEVKALGEIVDFAYGKALRAYDRKSGTVPVYGSNGQVGWHNERLVLGPGIVVGRKGNPGIVTWAHSDFFPIDTTFYVVPKDDDGGMPFLFFALRNQDLPSVSADSAVPGLNRNLAYMNRQLIPDRLIVDEFNNCAGAIFTRRQKLEEESRALAAQRDALLPRLVSGEVIFNSVGLLKE